MKTFTLLLAALMLALTAPACVENDYNDGPGNEQNNDVNNDVGNDVNNDPGLSELSLTYISGHLGSYLDCPGEGFDPDREEEPDEAAPEDLIDGDCADPCGPLNCEHAQVSVRLTNNSAQDADGFEILELLILDAEGVERASLPLMAVVNPDGESYDGFLAAGGEVDLRIEFLGPENLHALLADENEDSDGVRQGGGAQLRILFRDGTGATGKLETAELFSLPEVDT